MQDSTSGQADNSRDAGPDGSTAREDRDNSAGQDNLDAADAGTAADNEGFHAGPASRESDGNGDGAPGGGPEDPPEADQSPSGEQDPEQNPPLPRTWN